MAYLLLILWTSMAPPQQTDPVIEWLTSLQSAQSELHDNPSTRDAEQIANDVRAMQAEIAAWAAAQPDSFSIPSAPDQTSPEALSSYVANLREVLEQYERKKPGSPFYMGRIEVNVSAAAVQVPTGTTLE